MDDVTRPKRAARQRRSMSTMRDNEVETDEESLPSSARDSDSDQDGEDEGSSEEEDLPTQRELDPRAIRHSARGEAKKVVNYSTKIHPQDHSLPGYQHKAKQLKRSQAMGKSNAARFPPHSKKRAATSDPTSDGVESLLSEVRQLKRPHKRLSVLDNDREHAEKTQHQTKKIKETKKTKETKPSATDEVPLMLSDDVNDMVDMAIEGSQLPRPGRSHEEDLPASTTNKIGTNQLASGASAQAKEMAQEALTQMSSMSDAETGPERNVETGGTSSPQGLEATRRSVSGQDDGFMLMDQGDASDNEDATEDSPATGHTDDPAPSLNAPHGDAGAVPRTAAGSQPDELMRTAQVSIDHNFSTSSDNGPGNSSHVLETLQDVHNSAHNLHEGNTIDNLSLPVDTRSKTFGCSSRKGTSSSTMEGNTQHETHNHPSEFEDQFAVTEKQTDATDNPGSGNIVSDAPYDNLPVSDRERSGEHGRHIEASQGPREGENASENSLQPTDSPESALARSRSVQQADFHSSIASDSRNREQQTSPITSFDGSGHGPSHRASEQFMHGGENADPAPPNNAVEGAHAVTKSYPTATEAPWSTQRSLEFDDAFLGHFKSSQKSQPDILVSSDPTSIEDVDGLE